MEIGLTSSSMLKHFPHPGPTHVGEHITDRGVWGDEAGVPPGGVQVLLPRAGQTIQGVAFPWHGSCARLCLYPNAPARPCCRVGIYRV